MLRYGKWLRVDEDALQRAEGWFGRYGDWIVLVARVVPLARSIVSIPAGTARMPLPRFLVLTTIGSAAWNGILIGAGVALGANWQVVENWVGSYSNVVLIVGAVAVALMLIIHGVRRRNQNGRSRP